jgi:preprotein translocase subunit SecE
MQPRHEELRQFITDAVLVAAVVISLSAILWIVLQLP